MAAVALAMAALALSGCGGSPPRNFPPRNATICCFGDSLVAGVGATAGNTYPDQLGRLLGRPVTNWGTSGDTTADGVAKLTRFTGSDFGIIVLTLGGNDILRRVEWPETKANLEKLFDALADTGAVVVFTGVTGPLNPTRDSHYKKLCKAHGVLFVSDVLDGITGNSSLLADEIHPNDEGYRLVAQRVVDVLTAARALENTAAP